jgi:hypothetical protein
MRQSQLLAYAVLALAERGAPPSHRRDMLPDGPVEAVTVDGRIAPSTSASEPRVRAFHARGSSVMCPLSPAPCPFVTSPVGLVLCGLVPPPAGVSLPHASAWVLALLQPDSPRSLPHDRPHVSLSEALPSACASCGIPPDTPCGWHLLTTARESTCRVPPFPVPMACLRRVVRSTGLLWPCRPVRIEGCRRRLLCRLGSSASASCAGWPSRWLSTPSLPLPLDAGWTGDPE